MKKKINQLPTYEATIPSEIENKFKPAFYKNNGVEVYNAHSELYATDEQNKTISGVLINANKKIYRHDNDGEYYVVFAPETIEKIYSVLPIGYEVDVTENIKGVLVDKVITDDEKFYNFPNGSLYVTVQIENDEFWQYENKYTFSFEGIFKQELISNNDTKR